jgi:D-lyxose ketol-isomerase
MITTVNKGWGHELIWCSTPNYCGKHLVFAAAGNKFSMHFHAAKHETWRVQRGSFLVRYIDTQTAQINEETLVPGAIWCNPPLLPHQLIALEDNSIIEEVSTYDDPTDNYRVFPGDSQA